jgi:Cdc6-like AAA superfamily ATPase
MKDQHFYLEDLEKILEDFEHDREASLPKAITDYLNFIDREADKDKINLREKENTRKILVDLDSIPYGMWPSKFKLSQMQQVAVNLISNKLNDGGGIFSVNGPPGTGKTTLLKDVIADILVKKAEALSKFENPLDAFTEEKLIKIFNPNKMDISVFKINDTLKDFGIVVASSNNSAVENISADLPQEGSISSYDKKSEVKYFKHLANSFYSTGRNSSE